MQKIKSYTKAQKFLKRVN